MKYGVRAAIEVAQKLELLSKKLPRVVKRRESCLFVESDIPGLLFLTPTKDLDAGSRFPQSSPR
jgi:hypothetical protein